MKKLCGLKKSHSLEKCAVCVHSHNKLPCDPCKYLRYPETLNSTDYYDFFCFHQKHFNIDYQQLKATYMQFQSVLHPDKFSKGDSCLLESSNVVSSYCSNAYTVLTNDILRA